MKNSKTKGISAVLASVLITIGLLSLAPLLRAYALPKHEPLCQPAVDLTSERQSTSEIRGLIQSSADLAGNYIRIDQDRKRVLVRDIVWALSKDNYITIALLDGVTDDGKEIHVDRVDSAARLAFSPRDLVGGKMLGSDNREYFVDVLEYALSESRELVISAFVGHEANGKVASYGTPGSGALPPICCQTAPLALCRPHDCSGGCGTVSQCACDGTGECGIVTVQICFGECGVAPCQPGGCEGAPPTTPCVCVT